MSSDPHAFSSLDSLLGHVFTTIGAHAPELYTVGAWLLNLGDVNTILFFSI